MTVAAASRHPGAGQRARTAIVDVLLALAVIVAIPAAILAVGIPIALVIQLVLWLARMVV